MNLESGTIVNQYKIISAIGKGGMGEVFLAEDTKLDRRVALKILPSEFAVDADRMNRFVREAKSASALNHPNIITIHEIGAEGSTHYIATEFIEGETLYDRLKEKHLSLQSALEIAVQIVSALQAAHSANIIHRDIKPENVMIRADDLVKILDFGIAKLSENKIKSTDAEAATAIKAPPSTSPGMIIGTASYMSPEQAKGKAIDARSDIFSFGIVLYEMLSGKRAFGGDTPLEIISSILKDEPPPLRQTLPDLTPEIERIAGKTLRKDADERYQTARDLLTDLKDAKQELEFRDKLDRTAAPHREEEPKTQLLTAAPTDEPRSPTSSAEFITGEIKKHKRGVAVGLLVLLAAAIGLGYWFFGNRSTSNKQIESIAVMPFVNESGNQDVEYLSDGMTETLINSLSQIPNLSVKARSSVFRYKGKELDPKKIAAELNVQAILTGRIIQRGEQMTLNLELIDARTENTIWGNKYERKSSDLVSLQSEIARDVSAKLRLRLSGTDEQKLAKNYTENTQAYQLYLKGRYQLNKRTEESFRSGIEFFRQAIELDPDYALAYAGLADAYNQMGMWTTLPPSESFPKAKVAAERALQLDDSLAEAHTALAFTKFRYEWDFAGAERECQRAISLNPNYAVARELYGYQIYLVNPRRFDEAMRELKTAQEIDPLSLSTNFNMAAMLYHERQYDKALEQLNAIQKLDPNFTLGYGLRAAIYREKGMYDESVAAWNRVSTLEGAGFSKEELDVLREAYKESGFKAHSRKHAELLQAQAKEKYISPIFIAMDYAMIGEKELALLWLDKAYKERSSWLPETNVDPVWDNLRDDPRFKDLLKLLNLPE